MMCISMEAISAGNQVIHPFLLILREIEDH